MFRFIIPITLFNLFLVVYSVSVEDIESVFGAKHCVEASMVPFSLNQEDPGVLDSVSLVKEGSILNKIGKPNKSVISKIHELAQHNNVEFIYKLISEEGPPHSKTFKVNLILGDESYEGSGPSLNKAKQVAAAVALENTFYEHPPEKLNVDKENNQTPTVVLNNIAMKLGIGVSYYLLNGEVEQTIDNYGAYDEPYGKSKSYLKINSTSNPLRVPVEEAQFSGPFTVRVKVGDLRFKGIGHTIQAARHDAALNALKTLEHQLLSKDGVCSSEESAQECKQKKENLKSPITRIHEFAQRQNFPLEFNIISETGKSHQKSFVTQCRLGDFVTEGEGSSKKESKKAAAEEMLKNLPQLPEKYNEKAILNRFSNKKKRKKNKIVKDSVNKFMHSVSNLASSIWGSSDVADSVTNQNKRPQKRQKSLSRKGSLKDKMLELGGNLDVHVDFTDLSAQGNQFFSLMSLGLKPPHICLGKAATRETSHDVAALHGLKFLQKSGIFEKTEFVQYDLSTEIDNYELEEEILYKSVGDMKEEL